MRACARFGRRVRGFTADPALLGAPIMLMAWSTGLPFQVRGIALHLSAEAGTLLFQDKATVRTTLSEIECMSSEQLYHCNGYYPMLVTCGI